MPALLEVSALSVRLGDAWLVRDVSLSIRTRAVHALLGESGCGKSTLARALVGLEPAGAVVKGSCLLENAPPRRGQITLVPQEAQSALNPVLSVGAQLDEALAVHTTLRPRERLVAADALLRSVGLSEQPLRRVFPHQLSGGMRQRVLIAAALAASPRVLIADEPTTALDAPLRRQILELFRELAAKRDMGVLLITHELAAVERAADDISVMYGGAIVEQGNSQTVFASPLHPYTRALLQARPSAGFQPIEGVAPSPTEAIEGCRFRPRCPRAVAACVAVPRVHAGVACFNPEPRA